MQKNSEKSKNSVHGILKKPSMDEQRHGHIDFTDEHRIKFNEEELAYTPVKQRL